MPRPTASHLPLGERRGEKIRGKLIPEGQATGAVGYQSFPLARKLELLLRADSSRAAALCASGLQGCG